MVRDRIDAAALLEHRAFVARVARRLLASDEVEDAVQDTMVAALENPPPADVPARAWLARIARNVSIDRLRRKLRRRARERAAARADAAPSTAALAERVAWQQRVVDAILALEPSYREVVLLRYYEDLPPRRIAARLGVPVNTVRTRLRRAHMLLRGRLDREAGGRRAWSAALLPLAVRPAAPLVGMKAVLLLLAALLGSVGLLARFAWDRSSAPPGRAPLAAADAPHRAGPAATRPGASFATGTLVGVLPGECAAAGGLRAAVRRDGAVTEDTRLRPGPFQLAYDGPAVLELGGPGVRTRTYELPPGGKDLGRVEIERAVSYGGRVLDLDGKPLPGVTVYWGTRDGTMQAEATAAEGDAAFRLEVPPEIVLARDRDGNLTGHVLYVRRGRAWGGPYWAHPTGFWLKHDLRIDLEDPPTLRFVRDVAPADVRVALSRPPNALDTRPLAPPAATDAEGRAQPEWPPWLETALCRIEEPEGETVLGILLLGEVVCSDPYEIDLAETATVSLRVVEADGKTPAPGVDVLVSATWVPEGRPPAEVMLPGRTDERGEAAWRFLAEDPREGELVVGLIVLDDARGARPARTTLGFDPGTCTAVDGGLLPLARLAGPRTGRDRRALLSITPAEAVPQAMALRYFDAAGNELPRCNVRFTLARRDPGLWYCEGLVDDEGELPEGAVDAELHALFPGPRVASARVTRAALEEALAGKRTLALTVPEIRRARIRAVDAEGRPVCAAELHARAFSVFSLRSQSVTGADGRTVFAYDPAVGPWSVAVYDRQTGAGAGVQEWWTSDRELTVKVEPPRNLQFQVLFPDGTPAAGANVQLSGYPPRRLQYASGKGWCLISVVPSMYTIRIGAADRESRVYRATVHATDVGPDRPVKLERYQPPGAPAQVRGR